MMPTAMADVLPLNNVHFRAESHPGSSLTAIRCGFCGAIGMWVEGGGTGAVVAFKCTKNHRHRECGMWNQGTF